MGSIVTGNGKVRSKKLKADANGLVSLGLDLKLRPKDSGLDQTEVWKRPRGLREVGTLPKLPTNFRVAG